MTSKHYSHKTAWAAIRQSLEDRYGVKNVHAMRIESTIMNGVPDAYAQVRFEDGSRSVWIEIKIDRDPVRPLQVIWHLQEAACGGRIVVARFGLTKLMLHCMDGAWATGMKDMRHVGGEMSYPIDGSALAHWIMHASPNTGGVLVEPALITPTDLEKKDDTNE